MISPETLPEWALIARTMKELLLEVTDAGDMPPVVLALEGRETRAFIAPEIAGHLAISAARVLRQGLDPDALVVVLDLFGSDEAEGAGEPRAGEYQERYLAGDLAVRQSLLAMRIGREGGMQTHDFPYLYSGKDTRFVWLDSQALAPGEAAVGGRLLKACAEIAKLPPFYRKLARVQNRALRGMGPALRRQLLRRSALKSVADHGFRAFRVNEVGRPPTSN